MIRTHIIGPIMCHMYPTILYYTIVYYGAPGTGRRLFEADGFEHDRKLENRTIGQPPNWSNSIHQTNSFQFMLTEHSPLTFTLPSRYTIL